MNTNRNNELQKRYGHLLDRFTGEPADYRTKQEREEQARVHGVRSQKTAIMSTMEVSGKA